MQRIVKIIKDDLFKKYFTSYFLIVGGTTLFLLGFGSTVKSEASFYVDQLLGREYVFGEEEKTTEEPDNIFGSLINNEVALEPVSESFSIIIEKIGVNAPVIENVSVTKEEEYFEALKKGVAHARGKGLPGQPGNIYLFAHSSVEFWRMGPYATVFNQLRRLEDEDIIYLIYQGETYKYKVFDKKVVENFNVAPYEAEFQIGSILTLQTCDPPGTTWNRLIVRAYPLE